MITISQGRHFNFFLEGKIFFISQCHRTIEKLEKIALYVVIWFCNLFPSFFLFFSFFFSFLSLFSLFLLFFTFFFLFSFSLGGGGDGPLAPSNDAPVQCEYVKPVVCRFIDLNIRIDRLCDHIPSHNYIIWIMCPACRFLHHSANSAFRHNSCNTQLDYFISDRQEALMQVRVGTRIFYYFCNILFSYAKGSILGPLIFIFYMSRKSLRLHRILGSWIFIHIYAMILSSTYL